MAALLKVAKPPKRVVLGKEDWQTFCSGEVVGYDSGGLWHKELADMPVEVNVDDLV